MKVTTPYYYRNFKCIAGACTDTCCAGWDVDVDADSYRYYRTVKGAFGKRLKSVMMPSENGGCTFTLKDGGRCPFLNDENLCELFTELGEDKLCDTCAEFPRFINNYGGVREIGIAPSCKTAGEIILSYRDKLTFDTTEDVDLMPVPNDIDALTYSKLRSARQTAYEIMSDRKFDIFERLELYLEYARQIQKLLDAEKNEVISNVIKRFDSEEKCRIQLQKLSAQRAKMQSKKMSSLPLGNRIKRGMRAFFDGFKGMEVINPDWNIHADRVRRVLDKTPDDRALIEIAKEYDEYYNDYRFEYEQLAMYYIYRYFLDAVNDYDVLLKAKNAVIGILAVHIMNVCAFADGAEVDFTLRVDIAHLYSRQFEHSYYNYEVYREMFKTRRCYSYRFLEDALSALQSPMIEDRSKE